MADKAKTIKLERIAWARSMWEPSPKKPNIFVRLWRWYTKDGE